MIIVVICTDNKKKKKNHTVGTFPKSNIEVIERGKIVIPNIQMHDHDLFGLDTNTSTKSDGVELVLLAKF